MRYKEAGDTAGARIRFKSIPGPNVITWHYADWNHGRTTFAPVDSGLLAVEFQTLKLTELTGIELASSEPQVLPYGIDSASDVLFTRQPGVSLIGFSNVEDDATQPGHVPHRWALGPSSRIEYSLPSPRRIGLQMQFAPPGETVISVRANGQLIKQIQITATVPNNPPFELDIDGMEGKNTIQLDYSSWNHKDGKALLPSDPRPLAINLLSLRFIQP
jgi:hypothetical protein